MKDAIGFVAGSIVLLVSAVVLVPFALVLCMVVLVGDLSWRGRQRPTRGDDARTRRRDAASILILNWNGRPFLENLLPSVQAAVAHHGGDHEIVVIDNGSDDDSVEFVERAFPEVTIVRHPTNYRFVRGYNEAWDAASRDIVVLLNNDMVVDEGFLGPLLDGFAQPDTFAVSSQIFFTDSQARRDETGLTGGAMRSGVFKLWHDPVGDHVTGWIPTLWAGGGSSAFDKRRLLELGGFDTIYDPFYFEDTGLSYEAWKRGWTVLFAPESKVHHVHEGSSSRLSKSYVERVKRRNQHLFTWRHITAPGSTIGSTLLLPWQVPRLALGTRGSSLFHRAVREVHAVAATLPRILPTIGARVRNARLATRTDIEVFALASSRHRYERSIGRQPGDVLDIFMLAARVPKQGVDGSWGLFELVKVLGRRHRVTLVTLLDRNDDERHVEALRPFVHRIVAHPLKREVGTLDLHHRVPVRIRRFYTSPDLVRQLAVLMRTERFDVLQVDYVEMAAIVSNWLDGVRSVHVVHEPIFRAEQLLQVGGVFPRLARWLRFAQAVNYESRLYREFERIVCLSSDDADRISRWLPELDIAINPMGADIHRISACGPSNGHTMLSVSFFGHLPNVDATIWFVERVLPLVQAEIPDATLRLAGSGATDEIVALTERPGVELLGYVEDLAAEMEACALALAPVREGGGLRTKVLESFAYGRTMVVTPIGAAGILAEDGVHYRIADDERAFARAVVEVLRDDERRHAMERAARSLVLEHYTSEIMADRSEAIFKEMLS